MGLTVNMFLWTMLSFAALGGLCSAAGMKGGESRASFHEELARSIDTQETRAEGCKDSKYADVCSRGSVMIFEQTTFAACSPVGCSSSLRASSPGATAAVWEDDAADIRAAVIAQTAALLAEEKPGVSLKTHFQKKAVEFNTEEETNRIVMLDIIRKPAHRRDLPALRFAYEDAANKGFAHREIPRAAKILAWEASPAAVLLADQAAARASGKCSRKASGCPRGSFPIFSGCDVASCVHVPDGGVGSATSAKTEALERAAPALLKAADLKKAKKVVKAMAKERQKASSMCNNAIEHILQSGQRGREGVDLPALLFFVELGEYEGYKTKVINDGMGVMKLHMVEVGARLMAKARADSKARADTEARLRHEVACATQQVVKDEEEIARKGAAHDITGPQLLSVMRKLAAADRTDTDGNVERKSTDRNKTTEQVPRKTAKPGWREDARTRARERGRRENARKRAEEKKAEWQWPDIWQLLPYYAVLAGAFVCWIAYRRLMIELEEDRRRTHQYLIAAEQRSAQFALAVAAVRAQLEAFDRGTTHVVDAVHSPSQYAGG